MIEIYEEGTHPRRVCTLSGLAYERMERPLIPHSGSGPQAPGMLPVVQLVGTSIEIPGTINIL